MMSDSRTWVLEVFYAPKYAPPGHRATDPAYTSTVYDHGPTDANLNTVMAQIDADPQYGRIKVTPQ